MATKIEWASETWSPVTGCTRVSTGCNKCYAERIAIGFAASGHSSKYTRGFKVTQHPDTLNDPLHWKKPRRVFVCSMGDLFHEDVESKYISKVFDTMRRSHVNTFVVLTKRAKRMSLWPEKWPDNVWAGVSVEADRYMHRVDNLRAVNARVRLVAFEPLLGEIAKPNLSGIHWVIVGGETAPKGARKMEKQWVCSIQNECKEHGIPFFFTQWGDAHNLLGPDERKIDGKYYKESPPHIGDQISLF